MTAPFRCLVVFAMMVPAAVPAQATKVGPPRGTVIVVGGGAMGPEVYGAFIKAAGGPDALIVDVPTAGGAATYGQDDASARAWRNAGAHHVVVLHTTDRKLADSDSFAAVLKTAGGVVGGSSAGATILGDFLVRGAPSNDNTIMDDPRYEKGFAFLRGVGIDQHVVARERLADLADSIIPKYLNLLGMSEDEGTAWVVQGDVATILGRNKAFVYGTPLHDPRKPFLTLHPGDKYNLGTRQVMHRAVEESPVSEAFVDAMFKKYSDSAAGGATVLVAREGHVLIDKSYGIADQPKYMPTTTVPQFSLGEISAVFTALCEQLPAPAPARGSANDSAAPPAGRGRGAVNNDTPLQSCVTRRISTPIGMHKTMATADGDVHSSVDELYRLALGLDADVFVRAVPATAGTDSPARPFDARRGFQPILMEAGSARVGAFGTADGKRNAFVQVPESRITVIILTNDASADARGMALEIVNRLGSP